MQIWRCWWQKVLLRRVLLGTLGTKRFLCLAPTSGYAFKAFFLRGFSLPVHPFVRGLLFAYQLQLHDLCPNGILHIACFIMLCESFLGTYPHWGLWKRLFNVKRTNSEYTIGGVDISIKEKN